MGAPEDARPDKKVGFAGLSTTSTLLSTGVESHTRKGYSGVRKGTLRTVFPLPHSLRVPSRRRGRAAPRDRSAEGRRLGGRAKSREAAAPRSLARAPAAGPGRS